MGFFSKVWGYIKTAVTGGVESRMKPEIQIEQAMAEAKKQDLALRNQAAQVIAHRTEIQMLLDRSVEESTKARGEAGQALRKLDEASRGGDVAEGERWTRAANALAMKLEATESSVTSLKAQLGTANEQAEVAKQHVNENAMRVQELSAKRMELLGKLEQTKMQERVNATVAQLSQPLADTGPTIASVEDKINARMALASAKAELGESSVEGAEREVARSLSQASAELRLSKLREELGIAAPTPPPAAIEAPASEEPAS